MRFPIFSYLANTSRGLVFCLAVSVAWAGSAIAQETVRKDPSTGLIVKVVAGSSNIKAFAEPGSEEEKFTLDLLRPYYVIKTEDGYHQITTERVELVRDALDGQTGWVDVNQVYEWPTREGLQRRFVSGDRSEGNLVEVWDSEEKIRSFMDNGLPKYAADFEESTKEIMRKDNKYRPYPVLQDLSAPFRGGAERRFFESLVPVTIPSAGVRVEDSSADEVAEVLRRVNFVVVFDATGSMEKVAKQVAEEIITGVRAVGPQTYKSAKMGFVFFRDTGDEEVIRIERLAEIETAADFLRGYATRMVGGGDAPEPVLDALFLAANVFPWAEEDVQSTRGARKIIITVLNTDAHPRTKGEDFDTRVPSGMGPEEIGNMLAGEDMSVIALQAGPEKGSNLVEVLQTIATLTEERGGRFIPWSEAGLGTNIGETIKNMMERSVRIAETEADVALEEMDYTGDDLVIPMKILDNEKRERLREAGIDFNIDESGGILVRRGYVPDNESVVDYKIRVEKDILTSLQRFLSQLGSFPPDSSNIRDLVNRQVSAAAGEGYDPKDRISEVFAKKAGIKFKTGLLKLNVDEIVGMTKVERGAWSNRCRKLSDKLAEFLELKAGDFNENGYAWVPANLLP